MSKLLDSIQNKPPAKPMMIPSPRIAPFEVAPPKEPPLTDKLLMAFMHFLLAIAIGICLTAAYQQMAGII